MYIACITCTDRGDKERPRRVYQMAEQIYKTLPPLDALVEYHRDTSLYVASGCNNMRRGPNVGMADVYDYILYPHATSTFLSIFLYVYGCPRYEKWHENQRPKDWRKQQEEDQPHCAFIQFLSEGSLSQEAARWNGVSITHPMMSKLFDEIMKNDVPVSLHGYLDRTVSSIELEIPQQKLRKQELSHGLVHWLADGEVRL